MCVRVCALSVTWSFLLSIFYYKYKYSMLFCVHLPLTIINLFFFSAPPFLCVFDYFHCPACCLLYFFIPFFFWFVKVHCGNNNCTQFYNWIFGMNVFCNLNDRLFVLIHGFNFVFGVLCPFHSFGTRSYASFIFRFSAILASSLSHFCLLCCSHNFVLKSYGHVTTFRNPCFVLAFTMVVVA